MSDRARWILSQIPKHLRVYAKVYVDLPERMLELELKVDALERRLREIELNKATINV